MNNITNYVENILMPHLRKFGACETFLKNTAETVHIQLSSIIRHWDNRVFRNTLLLIGAEEGSYYEPAAKTDIRCLVVVAIRNSPIETTQSDSFAKAGLSAPISSSEVKAITSEAIRYFAKQDFSLLCKQEKSGSLPDIYGDILSEFPITAAALSQIAMTSAKTVNYKKVSCDKPISITPLSLNLLSKSVQKQKYVVFDGFDPSIDPALADTLGKIENRGTDVFIIDSFKSLTRNPKKLFLVIEYILSRGCAVATTNYYLENGHVEQRIKPLKAGHTTGEMMNNLLQTNGLAYKHKLALQRYAASEEK